MITSTSNYQQIFEELKLRIGEVRLRIALAAEGWGSKIIDSSATDLNTEFPDFKGLSVRNLEYMRSFAEAWPEFVQGSLHKPLALRRKPE